MKTTDKKESLKSAIIRTSDAGVHIGLVTSVLYTPAGIVVKLENSRRIYSWSGANSLSELATTGSANPSECKFSMPVARNQMIAIEVIEQTQESIDNFAKINFWTFAKISDDKIQEIVDHHIEEVAELPQKLAEFS